MLQWLLKNKSDEFEFQIIFANTGCENNETLDFVHKCEKHFNCEITWVERSFSDKTFKIVDYRTATRLKDWQNGQNPMELSVQKYGLPNNKRMYTTRELKLRPITHYLRSIGWKNGDYYTMIGIRMDEIDRISKHRLAQKIIYPLIEFIPTNKQQIYRFWNKQPFRLNLQNYEGNCVFCYKKSFQKLKQLCRENPQKAEFFHYLERTICPKH